MFIHWQSRTKQLIIELSPDQARELEKFAKDNPLPEPLKSLTILSEEIGNTDPFTKPEQFEDRRSRKFDALTGTFEVSRDEDRKEDWPTRPCSDLRPHKPHLSVPKAEVNRRFTHYCQGRTINLVD